MDEKEYDKLLRDAHLLGEFERKHPNPELKPGKCADCWSVVETVGHTSGIMIEGRSTREARIESRGRIVFY